MTLVQSRRQRLNGSSLLILMLIALLFIQCDPTKKTTKTLPPKPTKPEIKPRIDTVQWNDVTRVDDIIIINPENEIIEGVNAKAANVSVFLPLDAEKIQFDTNQIDNRDEILLHYYVGMKLGFQSIKESEIPIKVRLFDSRSDTNRIKLYLDTLEFRDDEFNMFFGGLGRSEVDVLSTFAQENQIPYMSGWQMNSGFIDQNEFYYQLSPGFQAYVLTILKHALEEFRPDQITLFGSKREESRIDEINRLFRELTGSPDNLSTFIVEDINELELLEMEEWKENEEIMVFIVPITTDYNLIHDFFRFLDFNELHENSVVYGITNWDNRLLYDHLENFDVRVTSLLNPDLTNQHGEFEEKFYSATNRLPREKAYEGFSHSVLLIEFIESAVRNDGQVKDVLNSPGIQARFVDHSILTDPSPEGQPAPTFRENELLFLLGYENSRYFIFPE